MFPVTRVEKYSVFHSIDKMEKLIERHKLPKLTQEKK